MNYTPTKSSRSVQFCTLAGVEGAGLDGEKVVGRWKKIFTWFYVPDERRLSEDFANWGSDPEDVLRFTRRYGPLEVKWQSGRQFTESLKGWRCAQQLFRLIWETYLAEFSKRPTARRTWALVTKRGELFESLGGRIVFIAATLWRLLLLDLNSCPIERLRKCGWLGCPNPYFVAHHLRAKYCSDVCAGRAQKRWKRRWWQEHGDEWRRQHRRKQRRRRR